MNAKRVLLAVVVPVIAVGACLVLLGVVSSTRVSEAASVDRTVVFSVSSEVAIPPTGDRLFGQAVSVTFPPQDAPWYAQSEISVHPEPPVAGHPTELCAEVINLDPGDPAAVTLEFGVSDFGIGVPFVPVGATDVVVPPGGAARGCVFWVPRTPGRWCIEVRLTADGLEEISQRNIDVWEPLVPGQPHGLPYAVGPFTQTTTITFATRSLLPGWQAEVAPPLLTLNPDEPGSATLIVTPPLGLLGSRDVIVDVEGYVDGELVGGFRKLDTPPVPLHRPRDPFFAESEIHVWPYPPMAGEPTEICVELTNVSGITREVAVQLDWAHFGIGLPFEPIGGPVVVEVPPYGRGEACIVWVPPTGGQFCLQARLEILGPIDYHPQFSQRNLDVAEPLQPGVSHSIEFAVGNHYSAFTNPAPTTTDIWLEADVLLPEWEVSFVPPVLANMAPGDERLVTMIVTPALAPLPPDQTPVVDVRALVDGAMGPRVIGGFRKIFRPPVPIHRFPDPPYAEREITVEPYPPRAGEPTEVCVELRNPTDAPQDVTAHFFWAHFGIGLPFTPINGPRVVHLPPHSLVRECIHWIPPVGGQVCLQVELEMGEYGLQQSQRNMDVDEPLEPGTSHARAVRVGNPFDHPVTITLGLIRHVPEDWGIALSRDVLTNVLPGPEGIREVVLTVTPTLELPPDEHPIVDVEGYVDGELIGGFRKVFRPPVPIHRPGDPIYAESEIFIHPYPPRAREPTEVGVEVRNPTPDPQVVTITLSAADFGIGLPFAPIHDPITVRVPPLGLVRPAIMWLPPHGGLWCIQVQITIPGFEEVFWSRRNIDVGEPLEPRVPHSRAFPVGNPLDHPVTITLGLIPHMLDWGLELSQDTLLSMGPGEVREVTLTVTPPDDLPGDGDPIVDVEAYAEGELIGGFRKIFRPPVPVHRPRDPVYAESEIGVDPYPVLPGQPAELSVEVFNPTDKDRIVTATFSIAPFGIGLPFGTSHIVPNPVPIFVPAHGAARGHVIWRPPDWRGKFCVQVTLEMEGYEPVWSRRNIDVGEPLRPGEPHSLDFPVGGWPYTQTVTVTLGLVNHREGWVTGLSTDLVTVDPGQPVTVTLTVTPPAGVDLGTGDPIVDVEGYVDGELVGGFRKMDIPPIPLHKPHEKGYAESEIIIDPYPPRLNQDSWVGTVVQNNGPTPITVSLSFGWAKFGMGIPFTTTGMTPLTRSVSLDAYVTATTGVTWTPSISGHQCVLIELGDSEGIYEPQRSQRNVDVVERPPCGHTQVFTFTVYNDSLITATVDIGLITFNVPADWQVTTVPSDTLELGPGSEGVVTVTVKIGCAPTALAAKAARQITALQEQAASQPTVDVEGYIGGELVGGIEIQFAGEARYILYLPVVQKLLP